MLAAGIRKITGLRQETAGLIGAGPHGWLADHIIKRRIRFQIIHLDDGGRLTGGEQCGTVIQQLNGIAVQPIPTILGIRIRLVGSRMRGGGLIVGEQLTEIHQAGYTSGGGAELDDLILHGVVVTAELGGQQHDVAVGIHRIIMMQNVVGSQIVDLLQLAETVHRHHMMRGRGEPHETVIIEQQTVRTIVEHRNLTAQHAVRIVVEHEILFVGIIAENRIQAAAQILT